MWKDSWTLILNKSNYIYGGVPPTLYDIKTEADLKHSFDKSLNVHKTKITRKQKFKRILAAYILRFKEAIFGIMGNEPSGKYKYPTHNTFH